MEFVGVNLSELDFSHVGDWPKPLRFVIFITAALITILLGYFLVLSGQIEACNFADEKVRSTAKAFAESEFKAANLDAYKKEVKTVRAQLETLAEQLPQKNELAGFLDDASQQAMNSGLKFVAIQPLQEVSHGFYRETEVILKMTGNYNAFGEFASNIANMRRIVTVHDFQIKKNDSTNPEYQDKNYLLIELATKTYWAAGGQNR